MVEKRTFTIEKGIPMPARFGNRKYPSKYPFYDMEVGNSFALKGKREIKNARSAAGVHARKHNQKFSIRQDPDGVTHCWRIK